jgi:hypothetical protein
MGGTIATLMAERGGAEYHGFIAIGAALDLPEKERSAGISIRPRIPLLFISNRSEIAGPSAYFSAVIQLANEYVVNSNLFRINRVGHVNVNQAERLLAIESLITWLNRGSNALLHDASTPEGFDATQVPSPVPSQVVVDSDRRGLVTQITEISAIYGNVGLDLQPLDLVEIGLTPGLWFELKIHDQTFRARCGKGFSSVEKGQWAIFPNADGYFWLSRN